MGVRVTPDLDTLNSIPIKADAGVEREPDIIFNGENYIVVWTEGIFAGMHKVKAARVNTEGAVLDSGIPFGKDAYLEYRPSIAFDGARALAVWFDYTAPFGVFGRFLNSQAQPDSDAIEIQLSNTMQLYQPDVAFAGNRYLVIWNEQTPYAGDEIFGQVVNTDGTLHGNVISIAVGPGYQSNARVTGGNAFVVVWDENGTIMAQRVSIEGELIGTNFEISDATSHDRQHPDIATGTTNHLAVWMQYQNSSYDIFGNLDVLTNINEMPVQSTSEEHLTATIIRGSLKSLLTRDHTLYDVNGRRVDCRENTCGVYFLKKGARFVKKIIKIR